MLTRPGAYLSGGFVSIFLAGFCPVYSESPSLGETGFSVGFNGHPLTQFSYMQVGLDNQMKYLTEAHAAFYRFDVPDRPDWAHFDPLLVALEKNHIIPVAVLIPPHRYSKTMTPAEAEKTSYNYAHMVASRYQWRIKYWELNNEMDSFCKLTRGDVKPDGTVYNYGPPSGWWTTEYDETRYQLVLSQMRGLSRAIRELDPGTKLIVNTGGWLPVGFLDRLLQDKLDFDIIGWHWYSEMGNIHLADGKPLLDRLSSYQKPLWITEGNLRPIKTPDEEQKEADYLQKTLAEYSALYPRIRTYCVYELFDESDVFKDVPGFGDEAAYGVIHLTRGDDGKLVPGAIKPAFDVVKNFKP